MHLLHAGSCVGKHMLHQAAGDTLATPVRRDVDAPDFAPVSCLFAVEGTKAGNGDRPFAVEGAGDVAAGQVPGEHLDGGRADSVAVSGPKASGDSASAERRSAR
jgi:hypothetical protein